MEIYEDVFNITNTPVSIALGNFDGVHKAHRKVILNCVSFAKEKNLKSGVLLFKNSPKPVKSLCTIEERIKEIEKLGVDFVFLVCLDDEFRKKTPEEFVKFLKNDLFTKAVSVGYDYRFGYRAEGDTDVLSNLCRKMDIEVLVCPMQTENGVVISSTNIRKSVENKDFTMAEALLGRPFSISGKVRSGFGNGRKLGVPTANIIADEARLLPDDGVYAGFLRHNEALYKAVINIGKNPTFDGKERTIESHIIGEEIDLYGEEIEVIFKSFIREEKKFPDKEALKIQIEEDRKKAISILS